MVTFPRERVPPDTRLISDIYVDESSQTQHKHLALGGLIVPKTRIDAFEKAIQKARLPELPNNEMAWTKVSRSKLAAYKRVVDVLFSASNEIHQIEFHSLYVDTHRIRDKDFNSGSRDVGFNKEIYQLGMKFARLHRARLFHLHLDQRQTKNDLEELRFILNCGIRQRHPERDWPFRRTHFVDSSKSQFIQLVDVLLGAICFHINGHRLVKDASPSKCELSDYILHEKAKVRSALVGTNMTGRFTIWPRQLR